MPIFKNLYISVLLALASSFLIAQPTIKKLGVEQGLSNETIRAVYQDRKGFMWFGTLDGLNRFDGYNIKTYHNRFGDSSSLLSNVIYGITEDKAGDLWLATRLGVCRLNRLRDNFTTISYQNTRQKKIIRLDREVIKTIACDSKDNILIASELQGLMIFKKATGIAIQIPLVVADVNKLFQYGVQSICFDDHGRTLVFVQDKGLCVLNYKQQRLELLNNAVTYVNSLLSDGNIIWMATNDGVYTYNIQNAQVLHPFSTTNGKLSSDLVVAITSNGKENICIGTMGGGLYIYNKVTGSMSHISDGDGKTHLSSSGIYSLLSDYAQRLWIGTRRGGINIVDHTREKFITVSHEPGNPFSLSGNFITSVCEASNGKLLVATEDNGLNILDTTTNHFEHFTHSSSNPKSLPSNNINNITIDYQGNIWLATYTDGVCKFNPETKSFKSYRTVNPKTGGENKVFNIFYEDGQKTLWASALRRGNYFGALYRYNRQKDLFEIFDNRLSDLFSLKEDKNGNFWGGGLTDLVLIDRQTRQHHFFYIGQFIRTITEGANGTLWLGTEGGGLVLFDTKKLKIIARYTTAQGLSNNSIFSTLQDKSGNLWLGTFNGLSKFNIKTKTFENYYRSDGLESDQFHFNAATQLKSGAFVFGGIKGYNVFYPDSLHFTSGTVPLRFTGIFVSGKPIEFNPGFIAKAEGSNIGAIAVPYKDAVFSFDFAALEYAVPDKISYAYYMEGWDKDWNYSGNNHTATYTHLSEGRYTFKVKSTNGDGVWKNEISIPVRVFPPWYRSWWAYLVYALIVAFLIYLYNTYRLKQASLQYEVNLQRVEVKREKAERERKEAELALEKAELETERTQRALAQSERDAEKALAEKVREENDRQAAFFTNISHEFRTPLSLIINPIKDILDKEDVLPEKEDRELKIVYRNAKRMLSITNQLLMFRRQETGLDKIYPVQLDLVALCKEVFLCFVQQAQAKKVAFQFNSSLEAIPVYADRDKMEIIFYNLLSNALKYVPDGGSVSFTIKDVSEEAVTVTVADSGPGIHPMRRDKIFEKFNQAKDSNQEVKPGFGIGLYLAQQFAGAHHASINYADTIGGGASFCVTILKGSNHFTTEQILQNSKSGSSVLHELVETIDEPATTQLLFTDVTERTQEVVVSEKFSVLIIDDNAEIREYLRLAFKDRYQVFLAENGEKGRDTAMRIVPDIIISDIMMEGGNGIDLCRNIKNNPVTSHIPVILLTGTAGDALKIQGIEGGADDYIMKPFDKDMLMARVANLIKNKNSLQQYFYNEITLSNQTAKISEEYREFLEKCIEIVENHFDDDQFNGKELAKELGVSYSSITKKVKIISGHSLNNFIRFVRLRKAARLFIDTNYNVNEVAVMVGIFDAKYFREQFNRQFNMNPSEFIKKYRKAFASKYTLNIDALNRKADSGE